MTDPSVPRVSGFMHASRGNLPVRSWCLGLVLAVSCGFAGPVWSQSPPALTVTAVAVKAAKVARTIALTGSIYAWQEIVIGAEVGGYRVDAVNVDVGDVVKRDQELVRLSRTILEAELASRRAALKQAEAQRINAEAAYRRAESLAASNVFSKADLDRLLSEQLAAQARVEAAQADVELAELRVSLTSIRAPYAGVVMARTVNVGEVAQAGGDMLRLLRDGRLEWRGEIPEARLQEVKVGHSVRLTTAGGAELAGKVRVVSPVVTSSNRLGLVYVDIAPSAHARPGMFARGSIEVRTADARLVPLPSIVALDGYNYVFVLGKDNIVKRQRVTTGDIHGTEIEVVDGIEGAELIVGRGASFLKDGDRVNVAPSP